jgi:uncharacterized protein
MIEVLFIFVSTFLAAIIQTTTGFGFSIIIMALWPMMFSVLDSVWLSLFGSGIIISFITFKYFKYINFKIIILPLLLSLIGTLTGLTLLVNTSNDLARRWLGALMILLSIYMFFVEDRIKIPSHWWFGVLVGTLSGVMGGFLNIPGPPIVVYMSVATQDKREYISTLQFFFFSNYFLKITYLLIFTEVHSLDIQLGITVFFASVFGIILGTRLFNRLGTLRIKEFTYVMMLLSGIQFLVG